MSVSERLAALNSGKFGKEEKKDKKKKKKYVRCGVETVRAGLPVVRCSCAHAPRREKKPKGVGSLTAKFSGNLSEKKKKKKYVL